MNLPAHKCGLSLTHNEHLNYYMTAAGWIAEHDGDEWQSDEAKARAIATGQIWVLQWYPDTPVGFCRVAAPTFEELIAFANSQ